MNEQTGKTPSSLAITEKKPYRPGGCVGIFYQFFDWNKRFAKKNFFSRKLLPHSHTKASKSFGGDEKMPKSKLHLIADENTGGFPNVKKSGKHFCKGETAQKHEMKAPGLVARLMGLEAMPALNRDKPNKNALTSPAKSDVKDMKMVNFQGGIAGTDLDLVKSSSKIEPRPSKIQKIEPCDRRIVTRFGAEALQIKNVLSQSKKHHHHQKFVSSVKSPRISSARNASRKLRLIDVATKILEPGLQATSRAKYSLSYSSQNKAATEGIRVLSPDVLEQSACNVSIGNSLIGPTSCKNCGSLLDVVESRAQSEDMPFVIPSASPNLADSSLQGLEKSWLRPSPTSFDQGKEAIFQRSHDQPLSFSQEENSIQSSNESNTFRSPLSQEARAQAQWHLTSQSGKSQRNEKSHVAFKLRNQSHNHVSLDKDRIPANAKLNNLQGRKGVSGANAVSGGKDFVALNRSSSSRTQHRVPIKVDSAPFEIERNSCRGRDDSLSQLRSMVRKRRTNSVNGQAETTGFINSGIGKEKNDKCNPPTRREMVHGACSMDRTCVKSRSTSQRAGKVAMDQKGTDVISFTFSSPLKQKHGVSMELKEKRKNANESTVLQRHEVLENNNEETSLPKNLPLTVDALSALLEQKLKELTSQEEERKTGCTLPKRSTAMILQELISALTSGQPNPWNGHLFSSDIGSQTEAKAEGTSGGFANHGNHFSPGSVLEASFSNGSFVSSSLDESLGHRLQLDSMDFSYDEPQPMEPDADLLDSATSLDKETTVNEMIIDLVNRISDMLHVVSNFGLGLSGDKLIHVKEVILKAELLFGNVTPRDYDRTDDFLLAPYIYDEVETLVAIMQVDFKSVLGIDQLKENNQLRGFLFDCALECIDSKYGPYCNSGFRQWRSLPYCMNSGKLIRDVADEVKKWIKLVGMVPDELIEYEMSYSLGKWTDFNIEAYETGVEMDWDILQDIIVEIVDDLGFPSNCIKAL